MRVGLMTCYIDNYGACLQAYALQNAIKSVHNCEIIRYVPYDDLKRISDGHMTVEPWRIKIIRAIYHPIKFFKRKIYLNKTKLRKVKFEEFRKQYLLFGERDYKSWNELKDTPPNYDAFVCGSDQIWNPVIHNNMNVGPYFLDFVPSEIKKVAYAPSIGAEEIPQECRDEMMRLIKRFNTVSVREQRGAEIIEEISGIKTRVVLDPTLLFDGKWWSNVCRTVNIKTPYIFSYLFNENPDTYKFVADISKKLGYKVITLPYAFKDVYSKSKKIYDAGPTEFLWLIKNASLIITDSFHATAFSINFNKEFYCILRNNDAEINNMNSRIFNILTLTGLESRLITNLTEETFDMKKKINYEEVNKKLNKQRKDDMQFLKKALEI